MSLSWHGMHTGCFVIREARAEPSTVCMASVIAVFRVQADPHPAVREGTSTTRRAM